MKRKIKALRNVTVDFVKGYLVEITGVLIIISWIIIAIASGFKGAKNSKPIYLTKEETRKMTECGEKVFKDGIESIQDIIKEEKYCVEVNEDSEMTISTNNERKPNMIFKISPKGELLKEVNNLVAEYNQMETVVYYVFISIILGWIPGIIVLMIIWFVIKGVSKITKIVRDIKYDYKKELERRNNKEDEK